MLATAYLLYSCFITSLESKHPPEMSVVNCNVLYSDWKLNCRGVDLPRAYVCAELNLRYAPSDDPPTNGVNAACTKDGLGPNAIYRKMLLEAANYTNADHITLEPHGWVDPDTGHCNVCRMTVGAYDNCKCGDS